MRWEETTRLRIARPARERVVGEVEARREVVEAVSAASSTLRRESWAEAKEGMSTALGAMSTEDVLVCLGCLMVGVVG